MKSLAAFVRLVEGLHKSRQYSDNPALDVTIKIALTLVVLAMLGGIISLITRLQNRLFRKPPENADAGAHKTGLTVSVPSPPTAEVPPAPHPVQEPPAMSLPDEIRKLHDLLTAGALSQPEYDRLKAALLSGSVGSPVEPIAAPPVVTAPDPYPVSPGVAPAPSGGSAYQPDHSPQTSPPPHLGLMIFGYLCPIVALFFCPPAFGIAGFTIGVINVNRNQTGHGIAQIILSLTCGVLGMIIGDAVSRSE